MRSAGTSAVYLAPTSRVPWPLCLRSPPVALAVPRSACAVPREPRVTLQGVSLDGHPLQGVPLKADGVRGPALHRKSTTCRDTSCVTAGALGLDLLVGAGPGLAAIVRARVADG